MELLLFLLIAIAAVAVVLWLFVARQGDAAFEFLDDQRTDFKLEELTGDKAVFSTVVPFVNKGTQDGTIMDCFPRPLLPQEQYDAAAVSARVELETQRRDDNYFEALIVPKTTGNAIVVTVTFTAKQGDIRQALATMVDMPVEIYFQVVARGKWYADKQRLMMKADEIAAALAPAGARQ